MTISYSEILTPPSNERLAGAPLPHNQPPTHEFLIATKPPFPIRSSLGNFNRNANIATARI
jgi:hypothetical protein